MWRRSYLLLILVRLYFALSPSYIHPDENFQGPEVIAGKLLISHEACSQGDGRTLVLSKYISAVLCWRIQESRA